MLSGRPCILKNNQKLSAEIAPGYPLFGVRRDGIVSRYLTVAHCHSKAIGVNDSTCRELF